MKFFEEVLVSNIETLKPGAKGLFVPYTRFQDAINGVPYGSETLLQQTANLADQASLSTTEHGDSIPNGDSTGTLEVECMDVGDSFVNPPEAASTVSLSESEEGKTVEPVVEPVSVRGNPKPVAKRGRGRDDAHVGSGGRLKARKTKHEAEEIRRNAKVFSTIVGGDDWRPDEEVADAFVVLSVAQALKSPESTEWQKVIDVEEARLLAYETWKPATDEELSRAKQVLPIAIVLTKKRCGKYKARARVLGNLDRAGNFESYAPVVSHCGNRLLLTCAAADGDYIIPYDLDSAFLNAFLEREVFVRLPPVWAAKHRNSVMKLQKALYGLKDAPRAWYNRYSTILKELGWEPCESGPGLWRKASVAVPGRWLKKSVYVDDNLLCGPELKELRHELGLILKQIPGREIETKSKIDPATGYRWVTMDFLGADVHYCREARSFNLTMETYIRKAQARFGVKCPTPIYSPNFSEETFDNADSKVVKDYPIREVVGALQWIATVARPDVALPVSTLARNVAKPTTLPLVKACRKVMKYLITTLTEGISYSPGGEEAFNEVYRKLLPEGRDLPEVNLFSDAGFANCIQTMRSTSGSIMYYKSTPIAWKSNRQGVRAYSTAESEYIAASDTIVLGEHNSFTSFFGKLPEKMGESNFGISPSLEDAVLWVDNTSAIQTAKSTDNKPKSRHYALRWHRVRDFAQNIVFCPTTLQKADPLTKVECSVPQRRLALHNTFEDIDQLPVQEADDEDYDGEPVVVYSVFFGF